MWIKNYSYHYYSVSIFLKITNMSPFIIISNVKHIDNELLIKMQIEVTQSFKN